MWRGTLVVGKLTRSQLARFKEILGRVASEGTGQGLLLRKMLGSKGKDGQQDETEEKPQFRNNNCAGRDSSLSYPGKNAYAHFPSVCLSVRSSNQSS